MTTVQFLTLFQALTPLLVLVFGAILAHFGLQATKANAQTSALSAQAAADAQKREIIANAVKAAQQTIGDSSYKYAYVASLVSKQIPGLDPEVLRMLIEAGVADLKMAMGNFAGAQTKTTDPAATAPVATGQAPAGVPADAPKAAETLPVPIAL